MSCVFRTRLELAYVLDGTSPYRNIAAIEAFLLFAEWPPLAPASQVQKTDDEDVMRPSKMYDALSWGYIGESGNRAWYSSRLLRRAFDWQVLLCGLPKSLALMSKRSNVTLCQCRVLTLQIGDVSGCYAPGCAP